jgi:hypothetical protein
MAFSVAIFWMAVSHVADTAAVGLPTLRLMADIAPPCPAWVLAARAGYGWRQDRSAVTDCQKLAGGG